MAQGQTGQIGMHWQSPQATPTILSRRSLSAGGAVQTGVTAGVDQPAEARALRVRTVEKANQSTARICLFASAFAHRDCDIHKIAVHLSGTGWN
jgi:hypothetical protein